MNAARGQPIDEILRAESLKLWAVFVSADFDFDGQSQIIQKPLNSALQWPRSCSSDIKICVVFSSLETVKGNSVTEPPRRDCPQLGETRRLNISRSDVPAVVGAFARVAETFANPPRRWEIIRNQFLRGLHCLLIGAWFDLPTVRRDGDEVGLLAAMFGHFKKPGIIRRVWLRRDIDDLGLDRSVDGRGRAEPRAARFSGPNNVGARLAGIGVRLLDRVEGNESNIIFSFDSNLLAERAANGLEPR